MTLEGRDAEYLSHKQNRKPNASKNINEYPVPQKKDDYHSCLYFSEGFNDVNFCLNDHSLGRQRNCSDQIRGE